MTTNPTTLTITLADGVDRVARQDPAFYVGAFDAVASVLTADKSRGIYIRCVGDLKVHLWKSEDCERTDDNLVATARDGWQLVNDAGLTSDVDLLDAEDRIEWANNPWFELFDTNHDGYHDLGEVYLSLDDAVQAAVEALSA